MPPYQVSILPTQEPSTNDASLQGSPPSGRAYEASHSAFSASSELARTEKGSGTLIKDDRSGDAGKSLNLAIPLPGDDLAALLRTITAIANVIVNNHSVSAATNYKAAPRHDRTPQRAAMAEMSPSEVDHWEAFTHQRLKLPPINWDTKHHSSPTSERPLKIARRRAEALNRLYKTDQAQPCHSVWFSKNHPEYLPLVKAMGRIIGIERDIVGGQDNLNVTEFADLQSINIIVSTSIQIQQRYQSRSQKRAINDQLQILYSRRNQLQALMRTGSKKRKESSISGGAKTLQKKRCHDGKTAGLMGFRVADLQRRTSVGEQVI